MSFKKMMFTMCFVLGSFFVLSGCGTNNNPNNLASSTVPILGTSGSCAVGSVYTSYGCLPQGSCQAGYALYNGTCVAGTTGVTGVTGTTGNYQGSCQVGYVQTAYGCLPQNPACTSAFAYGYAYGYYNGMCYKSVYL